MGVPIQDVGRMPWWAYRAALEGLAWEQPLNPRVLMADPDGWELPPDIVDDDPLVGGPGVFVGVRSGRVRR